MPVSVCSAMRRKGRYSRHLYNAYDLDLKKSVVIFAEQNGNKEAQAHYGISEANIRRWRRLKHDIFGKPLDYDRGKLRSRRRVNYSTIKVESEPLDQDSQGSVGESQQFNDSMPLQERLSKVVAQEKIAAGVTGPLKSQPLSPTKLKVTRQTSAKAAVKPVEPPQSPVNEEMCLRWNSHHSNMQTAFPNILLKEQYVDVTLAAEGKTLKCHRLILSSCSPYFEEILSGISPFQHPVLFMRDIPFWILKSLCDFMYAGEVHIYQNKLEELLTVAEALKIKGLAGKSTPPENQEEQPQSQQLTKSEASTNNNREFKKKHQPQQHHEDKKIHPQPIKKNPVFTTHSNNYESTSQDYDNEDLLDPLDLLEPLYEEVAEEKKPSTIVKPRENKFQYQQMKKPFTRRLRKRKYSEQRDPSPPPVFSFRKGTRSRPNVKIPKYYHPDFTIPPKPPQNSQTDPLLEVDEIKTEPIDVEDNLIDYSDEENHFIENNAMEPANCDSPIIITSKPSVPATPEKFKKIKLSKPIITDVHSIEEGNTTAGGLEVIKITLQQPDDVTEDKVGGGDEPPLLENAMPTITEVTTESEERKEEAAVNEETDDVQIEPPMEAEKSEDVEEKMDEAPEAEEKIEAEAATVDDKVEEAVIENQTEEEAVFENQTEEEEATRIEEAAAQEEEMTSHIHIEDVRTACIEEMDQSEEEERRTSSLDHLEKEAMNVANAITRENQEGPPDIIDDCK